MLNFLKKVRWASVISFINLIILIYLGCWMLIVVETIWFFDNKITYYESLWQSRICELAKIIGTNITVTRKNDTALFFLIQKNLEKFKILDDKCKDLDKKLGLAKKIDLDNVADVKQANILFSNTTTNRYGSGTHIKIKDKHYILTCSHLIKESEDFVWAKLDNGTYHPLELVKIDRQKDLALLQIFQAEDLPYLEISEEYPQEGSEVIIIGNPFDKIDMITNGIIAKIMEDNYIFTNIIFYGNSGGAILYKGKIVGVTTQIYTCIENLRIVNYGYGTNLKSLKEFLDMRTEPEKFADEMMKIPHK